MIASCHKILITNVQKANFKRYHCSNQEDKPRSPFSAYCAVNSKKKKKTNTIYLSAASLTHPDTFEEGDRHT